jgi:hypothetical protein
MDDSNDDLGEVAYVGKLKAQTFKQLQLKQLIKSGVVIPASKLAETKELELQRVRDFDEAAQEEERQRRNVSIKPTEALDAPLIRGRFEE